MSGINNFMKKGFYIFITIIFTVLTIGVHITKHFSDGDLYSISLFGDAKSCCEMPCDCCSDESDLYQLKADYIFSNYHFKSSFEIVDLLQFHSSIIDFITVDKDNKTNYFAFTDIPPPESKDFLSKIQTYLL